jgi:hypothetical protein
LQRADLYRLAAKEMPEKLMLRGNRQQLRLYRLSDRASSGLSAEARRKLEKRRGGQDP